MIEKFSAEELEIIKKELLEKEDTLVRAEKEFRTKAEQIMSGKPFGSTEFLKDKIYQIAEALLNNYEYKSTNKWGNKVYHRKRTINRQKSEKLNQICMEIISICEKYNEPFEESENDND